VSAGTTKNARPVPGRKRSAKAETLFYLRESIAHLAFVDHAAVEVVVDDEALAPVEVGGELVEVGVLGAG